MPSRHKGQAAALPFDGATDLHHRIAQSFALITDWTGALGGHGDMTRVVAALARHMRAVRVALYRLEQRQDQPRLILSHDAVPFSGQSQAITGALGQFALSRDGGRVVDGQTWRLSVLRDLPGFATLPADSDWQARPGIREVTVTLLGRDAAGADLIELGFDTPTPDTPELPASVVTYALSHAWEMRDPDVIAQMMARYPRLRPVAQPAPATPLSAENPYALTQSEMRVCSHVANRLTPKEIAATLGLSIATVRTHLRNLYGKTGTQGLDSLLHLLENARDVP